MRARTVTKGLILSTCAFLALVGCTHVQPVENPRAIWCDHNSPRSDATVETPRVELDEINSHNAKGELWCGWSP